MNISIEDKIKQCFASGAEYQADTNSLLKECLTIMIKLKNENKTLGDKLAEYEPNKCASGSCKDEKIFESNDKALKGDEGEAHKRKASLGKSQG